MFDCFFGKFVTCQKYRLYTKCCHLFGLSVVGIRRNGVCTVTIVELKQFVQTVCIDGKQPDIALAGQFINHCCLHSGRTEQRINITGLQLGSSLRVIQIHSVYQFGRKSACFQNLIGISLGSGIFLANGYGLSLQIIERMNRGIGTDNNLAGFRIQACNCLKSLIFFTLKDTGSFVGICS